MAKGDIISRLKLESGEFDSKIKRAGQELMAYSEHCRKTGLEMGYANRDAKDFAKELGNMATTATTARGRVGELSDAFINLKAMYNSMTEAEKQGEFGRNLLASLEQIKQRAQEAKRELSEMTGELNGTSVSSGSGGLFSGDKMSGMLQVFGGNLMTKGAGMVAGLFTNMASEISDCVKQGIELAKQGEGVRIAFERLGRGDILDGLREATHGTVTDLELMKAAVKFNDFKLPLDELGTMLAFAQQKAKDTGQSVDYMVDSIVTGLGRKSLMILDNLGLSATEVRERMKETGDMTKAVGAIIRDQMKNAGDYVETAADRAAQANVSLQNKMEELGRKFAPVEEASNQLWTSMKIGILDIIGGPLATLLNQLTEAGRLKNALNDINGDGSSGNTVVGGKLKQLQAAKNSGASQYMLNTMQSSTIEGWNRQIMKADELLKQFKKNHSSVNVVLQNATKQFGQKFSSISELEAWRDAYKVMVSDYRKGAGEIMKPVKVNIQTDNAIKSVDELKVKLAELQAQRKKVAAGSDEAKRLDTEIRQVKADIKLQDPSAVNTGKSKQQQAEDKVAAALQDYQQTIDKASLELKSGVATEADVKKKQLSAQERLYDAYGDAYALYKDPKYKDAQDKAAEEIVKLGGEVKAAAASQEAARKSARELESAQKKLADAQKELANAQASGDLKQIYAAEKKVKTAQQAVTQSSTITVKVEGKEALEQLQKLKGIQTIKVNVEEGKVNLPQVPTNDETIKVNVEHGKIDLPKVPTDDQTIKVNVVVDNAEAIQSIQQLEGVTIDVPVNYKPKGGDIQPVDIPLTTGNIEAVIANIKEKIVNADLGSSAALSLQEGLSDATAIGTILQTALQNGIDTAQFDTSGLMQKLMSHKDISDEDIQSYVDQLNSKLMEKFDETEWPNVLITFDADTKNIINAAQQQEKESQKMAKNWQAAGSAIQAVGNAMQQIEDPAAKVLGTIAQAVATMALSYSQAAASPAVTGTGWGWIAFAATGVATMLSSIAAIKQATAGFSNGGVIPGNSMSGDNLRGITPDGTVYGLNSQEIILNRAQQGNLASQLEGGGMKNLQLDTVISGESIQLVLNNRGRRTGRGEIVQSRRK